MSDTPEVTEAHRAEARRIVSDACPPEHWREELIEPVARALATRDAERSADARERGRQEGFAAGALVMRETAAQSIERRRAGAPRAWDVIDAAASEIRAINPDTLEKPCTT